ncbi:hypothetical protein [Gloeocapsopsis sp. IPPAS B-1203]|uniref:hypothetical protein n=1 Tax=Gloeocapsopsis sp. IPPAS B-1203 TaxID=2049454 RepID=UPI0025A0EE6C|nr:hypothetical protein [Gloeocapsopsis sp. IPPAS B-1203]
MTQPGQKTFGFLIVGISALRPLDDDYRGFFDLVAGQVTTAIANSFAYEEECKRLVCKTARSAALAELDRAKTTFFNNVSHECRTLLTLILGAAEDTWTRDISTHLSLTMRSLVT